MIKLSPKLSQKLSYLFLFLATILAIIPGVLIISIIIAKGWSVFFTLKFLTSMPTSGMLKGGILPAIIGTFLLVIISIFFVLPIGVGAAIYLNEYSKNNLFTKIIKLAIINLAGVPSIVYGLFGLGIFVIYLKLGVSIIAGALTLSMMELPVVITTAYGALNSVPLSFREASLSLGVSRWKTIVHIVLPNAIPGILTGAVLSTARIAGETAPLLFTAVAFYTPHLPHSIRDQVMILPYHLYITATQIPNMEENRIFATALALLIIVLSMNFIAIIARIYFRKNRKW
ncbi:MAG: phosphate ABC transporter permease PstA [Endomicrobium sp.]|jgi:phosphate transport system permease protein|nr:phosphate ABC transporter permease PstA [Endomicrobium sp.]